MRRLLTGITLWAILFVCSGVALALQGGKRDDPPKPEAPKVTPEADPPKPVPPRKVPGKVAKKPVPKTPPVTPQPKVERVVPAELTVYTNPSSAIVSLNGSEFVSRNVNGALRLTGLKPGSYNLLVSQTGYGDERRTVDLTPGQAKAIEVTLYLLPGKLNVNPSVAGAEITVRRVGAASDMGSYAGRVSDLEVVPGLYRITVSRDGYITATREVTVEPAKSAYLEPLLEPALPPPVRGPRIRPDAATAMQVSQDGKYLIVTLTGRSGDLSRAAGALDVAVGANDRLPTTRSVSGMLTGLPCHVDFVRIENVAEYSFVEPPGIANQWGMVVVRIRPKDSKRVIRFAINWRTLQGATAGAGTNINSSALRPPLTEAAAGRREF